MPRSDVVIGGVSLVPHAGVADERDVGLQLVACWPSTNSGRNLEPSSSAPSTRKVMSIGQRARHGLPGAAGLDEGHDLALVVAGAARADDLAPIRQRRHAAARRAASPRGPADRPAARRNGRRTAHAAWPRPWARARPRPDGRRVSRRAASSNAERLQIGGQPLRRRAAIGLIGAVGGDRGNAQRTRTAARARRRDRRRCGRERRRAGTC